MNLSDKRDLVTGVGGFIGSYLVEEFVKKDPKYRSLSIIIPNASQKGPFLSTSGMKTFRKREDNCDKSFAGTQQDLVHRRN